jgi:site-specific DNA recombinase
MNSTRAVIYPRVSSLIQRDRHTIASQMHELPAFAQREGWTLTSPPDTYVDDGHSAKAGKLAHRAGFLRLLRDMGQQPRPFDVVVVVDMDRITRSEDLRERGEILGAFQTSGVKIAVSSTGQVLDLNSSIGDLQSALGAFFSAEENRKRRERTVRGKLEAIRQGRKPAGPTPFGFIYSRDDQSWQHDPVLAPIVREIFGRVIKGESCESIAVDLQARHILRAKPSRSGRRKPGRWDRERVWQIVRNPVHRGEWVADKRRNLTVKVPPIVNDETWWSADAALNRYGKRGLRRTKHTYLLQKIAVCAICGAQIGCTSVVSGARDRHKLWYYVCTHRRRPGEHARCTLPMLPVGEIDRRVWMAIVQMLSKPKYVEAAITRQREESDDQIAWTKDLASAEAKLAQHDSQCSKMAERYRRGLIGDGVYDVHLEAAKREREMLSRQAEAAKAGIDLAATRVGETETLLVTVARLRESLEGADVATRAEIVRTLVPGSGAHVVRLGAKEIEINVVLAAESRPPARLPTLASG